MTEESKKSLSCEEIATELNFLPRSNGSSIIIQGESNLIVSVNGPMEVTSANLNVNRAYVDTIFRSKSGQPCVNEKFKEQHIRSICETIIATHLYPRTQITIQIQELITHGNFLAPVINAVNLAIMNSGIEMKTHVASVQCFLDENGEFNLDSPKTYRTQMISRVNKSLQSPSPGAYFLFVFESINKKIVSVFTEGKFSAKQYSEAEALCRNASGNIFQFYRETTRKFAI